jgi:hypothetical protein
LKNENTPRPLPDHVPVMHHVCCMTRRKGKEMAAADDLIAARTDRKAARLNHVISDTYVDLRAVVVTLPSLFQ